MSPAVYAVALTFFCSTPALAQAIAVPPGYVEITDTARDSQTLVSDTAIAVPVADVEPSPAPPAVSALNLARLAAVADGVSTHIALSGAAHESNPLVNPSIGGLVLLTAAKVGLVQYANTLPEKPRAIVLQTTSALWGGAAVNNLMLGVAGGAWPLAVGVAAGYWFWVHEGDVLAREKALRNAPAEVVALEQ